MKIIGLFLSHAKPLLASINNNEINNYSYIKLLACKFLIGVNFLL